MDAGVWRLLPFERRTGEENMTFDRALADRILSGDDTPTLRFYGWRPWSISLGYHQSERDIDLDRCRSLGIDVVRRPTGGRAILHANELTYSVTLPADGRGITEIYAMISRALVAGLSRIAPDISYANSQPNLAAFYQKQESIPCFSASARYEVQIGGRKLVGSAQRRFTAENGRESVLQHGSILLGPEHRQLAELLTVKDPSVREKIREDIDTKTIDLAAAVGRTVTPEEAADAVRTGFEHTLNIQWEHITESVQ